MAWTFYELRFRLLSPLHIGQQKIGNIQRTRPYVPARTLWGAVTARMTRMTVPRAAAADYKTLGAQVAAQIAFTYLFPTNRNGQPLYPNYADRVWHYGSGAEQMSTEQFAWRYLGSYAATALNYERNAAEDASLHEVEFITPQVRGDVADSGDAYGNLSHPVHLLGYAVVADGCRLRWRQALQEIQIGGERSYGWGRLRLLEGSGNQIAVGEAELFGCASCEAKTIARPHMVIASRGTLLAHTAVVADGEAIADGEIEPLVGRVWDDNKGAGQTVEFTDVCYAPGAKLEGSKTFEMAATHIWKLKSPQP